MYFDDMSGDNSDGSSSLTESIIGAISQVGSAAILSSSQPSQLTPYPPPGSSYGYGATTYGAPKTGMSWAIVALLIVAGIFAFKKL